MLDSNILNQVTGIFANLDSQYTFLSSISPQREEATEMIEFLNDFASTSPKLSVQPTPAQGNTFEFSILKNGESTGLPSVASPTVTNLLHYYLPY